MRLETFFENFDTFMNAPDADDGMRELILQLAVRGKLTSQSSAESAESQLHLANNFRARHGRKAYLDAADVPFLIPENWKWIAIGDTMDLINGKAFKSEEWSTEGTPIVRIQNLNNENATFNRCKIDVDPKVHVNSGDFLISWSGTPGTSFGAFIWNRGFAYLNQHIFRCELAEGVFVKEFLRLAVNARLDEMISHAQGGVGLRHITKGKLESIYLPLPPLAEQKRIVAKVDELIALCNLLDARQKEREAHHAALTRAAATRFNDAPTSSNLDFIFHKSYSVPPAELRKTIIDLAVKGKLVFQNPYDEPAAELLKTIKAKRLSETGKDSNGSDKFPSPIETGELSYSLPAGWTPARLSDLVIDIQTGPFGSSLHKSDYKLGGTPVINPASLRSGKIEPIKEMAVDTQTLTRLQTFQLAEGDIIMARRGEMGRCAIVTEREAGWLCGTGSLVLRMANLPHTPYLAMLIGSNEVRDYLESVSVGMTMQNLSQATLAKLPIGVPPLAEQRRISAKVDQLMAFVDQLDKYLITSQREAPELLDAVVHELLHPRDAINVLPNKVQDSVTNRRAIGCYAIGHLIRNPNFGRTMLMKIFYLSEAHSGISQGWEPRRQAAGPYDPAIEDFESLGVQSGWFDLKKKTLSNGHEMVQYKVKSGLEAKIAEAVSVFGGQKTEFDRLLHLFQNKTTEEAEIIATLFAAWNDLLIDGKSPSDDEIIREVRENWHYKKERFTPTLLTRWLNWLRQQSVIPRGLAPRTRQQLKLGLS